MACAVLTLHLIIWASLNNTTAPRRQQTMNENKAILTTLLNAQHAVCEIDGRGRYFEAQSLNRAYYLLEDVIKNVYLERTTDLHPSEVKAVVADLEGALDHVSNAGPFEDEHSNHSYYEAMALLEGVLTVLS